MYAEPLKYLKQLAPLNRGFASLCLDHESQADAYAAGGIVLP